jgi:Raf kinase inhibitor-like YbhB/YbcL family protein
MRTTKMKIPSLRAFAPCVARALVVALGVGSVLGGASACNKTQSAGPPRVAPGHTLESITVTSSSFPGGGRIPIELTCDGKDVVPQLSFSAPPQGTQSIAIIVDDPDAPSGLFTHMIAYNLPADFHAVTEGEDLTTVGARYGSNDFGNTRYNGPCPPKGEAHRYQFTAYALDRTMDVREGLNRMETDAQLDGHLLAQGTLVGTFSH